jgi:arginine decarboxylase-like protein
VRNLSFEFVFPVGAELVKQLVKDVERPPVLVCFPFFLKQKIDLREAGVEFVFKIDEIGHSHIYNYCSAFIGESA